MSAILQIGVLLAVGLAWLLLTLKAGVSWLKFISLMGVLTFMGLASLAAVRAVF
jgi:hypothetical protein